MRISASSARAQHGQHKNAHLIVWCWPCWIAGGGRGRDIISCTVSYFPHAWLRSPIGGGGKTERRCRCARPPGPPFSRQCIAPRLHTHTCVYGGEGRCIDEPPYTPWTSLTQPLEHCVNARYRAAGRREMWRSHRRDCTGAQSTLYTHRTTQKTLLPADGAHAACGYL